MQVPPVLYLSGIGEILTRIICSHIIIVSENVFYSHDTVNADFHTYTVFNKYWPASNFSTVPNNFWLPPWNSSWQDLYTLGRFWNVTRERGVLERETFGNILPFEGNIYLRTNCVHSLILFTPKRVWNFKIGNKPTWYFPLATSLGYPYDFLVRRFTIPTILLEVVGNNHTFLTWHEIYGLTKASWLRSNLISVQSCSLKTSRAKFSNYLFNCSYFYYCTYCFPVPKLLAVSSGTISNLKLFLAFISMHGIPKYYDAASIWNENLSEYRDRKNIFRFQKGSKHDVRVVLALLVVEKSHQNLTLIVNIKALSMQQRKYLALQGSALTPTVYAEVRMEPRAGRTSYIDKDRDFLFAVVGRVSYAFLTCHSSEYLNFHFYALPFQSNLWIGVLVTIIVLIVCFSTLLGRLSYSQRHRFSPLLYMIRCLLENGPNLPTGIESKLVAKLLAATWLILSLIAANGYKGIVSTDVTAPLPKTTPYKLFTDLVDENFNPKPEIRVFANLRKSCLEKWQKVQKLERAIKISEIRLCDTSMSTELLSVTSNKIDSALLHQTAARPFSEIFKFSLQEFLTQSTGYWLPARPNQSDTLFQNALESEIVRCQNKAVLVGKENYIGLEYQYLQQMYPTKTFFKVQNESLLSEKIVWRFTQDMGTRVPQKFVALLESGIYQQVKKVYQNWKQFGFRHSFSRKNSSIERVQPLTLLSNLRTLFYLFAVFMAVALCIGLAEIMWNAKQVICFEIITKAEKCIAFFRVEIRGIKLRNFTFLTIGKNILDMFRSAVNLINCG